MGWEQKSKMLDLFLAATDQEIAATDQTNPGDTRDEPMDVISSDDELDLKDLLNAMDGKTQVHHQLRTSDRSRLKKTITNQTSTSKTTDKKQANKSTVQTSRDKKQDK